MSVLSPTARRALTTLALAVCAGTAQAAAPPCNNPPLFDLSGATCSTTKQNVACGCSECIQWDHAAGATWYEVRRCNALDGTCTITGDTRWKNTPSSAARMWCAAWDAPFPLAGIPYDYTVRACKDGTSGPICATQLSNSVRYVAAPYMCISGGLEIPCATFPASLNGSDTDGDGAADAVDSDDDNDAVEDVADNCSGDANVGQRDADGDGIGDACDLEPRVANATAGDTDGDGIADALDVCKSTYDPQQADVDVDRVGDACDNCVSKYNQHQSDSDRDGEGDRCDLDDDLIDALWKSKIRLAWDPEYAFTTWTVYRGDLKELRASGAYTQAPGSNALAARWCGVTTSEMDDAIAPLPGSPAFYLVAGRSGTVDGDLGADGDGKVRINTRPCP